MPEQVGTAPAIVYGDVGQSHDIDFYELRIPDNYSGTATIEVRTTGMSLLAPRLRVYNSDEQLIAQGEAFVPNGARCRRSDLSTWRKAVFVGRGCHGRDVFAIGGYSLIATFDSLNIIPQATVDEIAGGGPFRFLEMEDIRKILDDDEDDPFHDDDHTDDDVANGNRLKTTPGFIEGTRYDVIASIVDVTDVDFYDLKSPAALEGQPTRDVMTIHVESLDASGLIPELIVVGENRSA